MTKNSTKFHFEQLRNRMLNDVLLGIGIIGIPIVIVSIWRSSIMDFQSFTVMQVLLLGALWGSWLWRAKLSYSVRCSVLLAALFLVTFSGFFSHIGLVADSQPFILLFAFSWWQAFCSLLSLLLYFTIYM